MDSTNNKPILFIDIGEGISIPVPRELKPEEEAAIIAQYKAKLDLRKLESECKELLEQLEKGTLVSAEEVLRELEEMDARAPKESA